MEGRNGRTVRCLVSSRTREVVRDRDGWGMDGRRDTGVEREVREESTQHEGQHEYMRTYTRRTKHNSVDDAASRSIVCECM
jgi:hypothetical protein